MKKGKLYVISSPSGGGKSTVIRMLRKENPELYYSVSATTRPPRTNEKEGTDYYFLNEEEFKRKIASNEFIEWAQVHGYYYGTLKYPIVQCLNAGKKVLLDIDIQGGVQVKKIIPEAILIFLLPPSMKTLETRLRDRGTDSDEIILRRLKIAKDEMKYANRYNFQVINYRLEHTVKEIMAIIHNTKD